MGMTNFSELNATDKSLVQEMINKGEVATHMAVQYFNFRYKLLVPTGQ